MIVVPEKIFVATPSFFRFPFHFFKSALLLCHIIYGKRETWSLYAVLYQFLIGNGIWEKDRLNSTPACRLKILIFLTTRSVKVLSFSYSRHDPHCSKQLLIKDRVREVIQQPQTSSKVLKTYADTKTHLFVKSTYKYTVKKKKQNKPKVKVHCFSSLTWNKRVYKYCALVWPVLFYKLASKWAVILHMRLNAPRGLVQTPSPCVHEIMCKWFFACAFVTSSEYLIDCTWKSVVKH